MKKHRRRCTEEDMKKHGRRHEEAQKKTWRSTEEDMKKHRRRCTEEDDAPNNMHRAVTNPNVRVIVFWRFTEPWPSVWLNPKPQTGLLLYAGVASSVCICPQLSRPGLLCEDTFVPHLCSTCTPRHVRRMAFEHDSVLYDSVLFVLPSQSGQFGAAIHQNYLAIKEFKKQIQESRMAVQFE